MRAPRLRAVVKQKCAVRPETAIRAIQIIVAPSGIVTEPSQKTNGIAMMDCITQSQNRIVAVSTFRVRRLVYTAEIAKKNADISAVSRPILTVPAQGIVVTQTPRNPNAAQRILMGVRRSPSNRADRKITQIGDVNSSAKSSESGIRLIA